MAAQKALLALLLAATLAAFGCAPDTSQLEQAAAERAQNANKPETPASRQTIAYVAPHARSVWVYSAKISYSPVFSVDNDGWRITSVEFDQKSNADIWLLDPASRRQKKVPTRGWIALTPLVRSLAFGAPSDWLIVPGKQFSMLAYNGKPHVNRSFEDMMFESAIEKSRVNAAWVSPDGRMALLQKLPWSEEDENPLLLTKTSRDQVEYWLFPIELGETPKKSADSDMEDRFPEPKLGEGQPVSFPEGLSAFNMNGISWMDESRIAFALTDAEGENSGLYAFDARDLAWTHLADGASMAVADIGRGVVYRDFYRGVLSTVPIDWGPPAAIRIPEMAEFGNARPIPSPSGELLALAAQTVQSSATESNGASVHGFFVVDSAGRLAARSPDLWIDKLLSAYWSPDERFLLINYLQKRTIPETALDFDCFVWDISNNEVTSIDAWLEGLEADDDI